MVADIDGMQSSGFTGMDCCPGFVVGGFFDIVSLMKGHVGDGAWSGGFKAPGTSF